MTEAAVCIRGMGFSRDERRIFETIDLDIRAGEITAVMGPSGTGKTTLMRLITGQIRPDCGTITVLGENLARLKRDALMRLRRRISMLFQNNALFTDMTVAENVAFPLHEVSRLDPALIEIMVPMKLQAVGLRGAADLMPAALSGGMARRAALARAIAMDPDLIIYDEPFTGQDPITLGVLTRLVRDLNSGLKMTSLVISHDIVAVSRIADSIVLLSGGKVVAHDSPEALMRSGDPLIAQFMRGTPDGPVPFHYPVAGAYAAALGNKTDGPL